MVNSEKDRSDKQPISADLRRILVIAQTMDLYIGQKSADLLR